MGSFFSFDRVSSSSLSSKMLWMIDYRLLNLLRFPLLEDWGSLSSRLLPLPRSLEGGRLYLFSTLDSSPGVCWPSMSARLSALFWRDDDFMPRRDTLLELFFMR